MTSEVRVTTLSVELNPQLSPLCFLSVLGTMCYPGTNIWVPILYGMEIPDPEGSGLSVPVLGMEIGEHSTDATPLAGSMEDVSGKGKRGCLEASRNLKGSEI